MTEIHPWLETAARALHEELSDPEHPDGPESWVRYLNAARAVIRDLAGSMGGNPVAPRDLRAMASSGNTVAEVLYEHRTKLYEPTQCLCGWTGEDHQSHVAQMLSREGLVQ